MALNDEVNVGGVPATMLVSPTGGVPMYGNNANAGFGDGNGWWIILLFIILFAAGGWNGANNGNNGYNGMPIVVNDGGGSVQRGFDQAAVMGGINGIQCGLNGISTQLCNGFAGVEQGASTRQIANMQQAFAMQTAITQGLTMLQSQLAQCCCDNRLATEQLRATVAQENCADREALNYAVRDLIANQNAGFQGIKDVLCADKIEAKNDLIAQLRSELMFARGQASQDVQTAAIQSGQRILANEIEQYVVPRPIPAYVVQNPNCCGQNMYTCA